MTDAQAAHNLHSNAGNPKRIRSKASNGRLLLMTDGRSATARRFKDLVGDISADLGGREMLSEGQRQLIRRAAMLSAECERQEALAARGEAEFNCDATDAGWAHDSHDFKYSLRDCVTMINIP